MTRPIKFRAWDIAENKMIKHPSLWTMDLNGGLFYGNAKMTKNDDILNYPIILMQYTGLKDKQGKEIYEGDILKIGEVIGEMTWKVDAYFFQPRVGTWGMKPLFENWNELEIIGNIYQNPELLK